MRRILAGILVVGIVAVQASSAAAGQAGSTATGWRTLFDGKSLTAFNTIGDANWQLVDGVVQIKPL